jgi:hypothetical protein
MAVGTKGSSSLLMQQDSHVVRGASYEGILRILDILEPAGCTHGARPGPRIVLFSGARRGRA